MKRVEYKGQTYLVMHRMYYSPCGLCDVYKECIEKRYKDNWDFPCTNLDFGSYLKKVEG